MMSSWLKMVPAATLWLMVSTLGAASEIYDDGPLGDLNLMYQEHNFIDPGPFGVAPDPDIDQELRNFLLYKVLTSDGMQDASPNTLNGPKWMTSGTMLVPPNPFELSLLKGPMVKRAPKLQKPSPTKPATPKWKNKKVRKVGSNVVCYFKLCAFRTP